ncbi:MAG TPA: serine hydrolase domain-containing protein [Candidatus Rubrimentiphilum sp.]|nr:serine hydrolase domain-containing protein [Candidatus Rubrimentiphilum sp.]
MIHAILLVGLTAAQISTIESSVRARMAAAQIPSVVLRIDRDGKNVYARAFGYRDVADRVPATLNTRYQYGSVTKQFTAAAILTLFEDGRLSLDDRVGKWLPEFAKFPITIRQLLVHTSGVADYTGQLWYLRKDYTNPFVGTAPLLEWSASQKLEFAPGTKAEYDNAAYTMLARIVERASKMPFFSYLQQRFFKPLGMTSVAPQTFFKIEPNTARGYMVIDTEDASTAYNLPLDPRALVPSLAWNMEQVDGAGYLVGDAADLQKWDNALLAGRVFKGAATKLFHEQGMLTNGKPTYTGPENPANKPGVYLLGGLGYFFVDNVGIYGANGGTSGFLSFTATMPSKHISITTLTNHGADLNNSLLTFPIVRALLH